MTEGNPEFDNRTTLDGPGAYDSWFSSPRLLLELPAAYIVPSSFIIISCSPLPSFLSPTN